MPTFGSLFAGIGGIDLGLERAGWECRWQVEWDAYCQAVLAKHWPDVPRYGDITNVDWSGVERVDLLAGGFPCQPVSVAGRQLAQDDPRWLWPEFARSIRALRPRLVLVENVPGLLGHGLGDVLRDLAESGYDARWDCVSAAAVGAPHLRDRVWVTAWAKLGRPVADPYHGLVDAINAVRAGRHEPRNGSWHGANAASNGRGSWRAWRSDPGRPGQPEQPLPILADAISERGRSRHGEREDAADAHPPGEGVGPGWDGGWWTTEPDVGRVAHGVPARVDRLRALGNAVVPQVVEVIGRQLLQAMKP